jgi:hypothetical protein
MLNPVELCEPQPPPITQHNSREILSPAFIRGVQDLQPDVAEILKARKEFGLKKYGTTLKSHNGRDPRVDALQEAVDSVVYLQQCVMEEGDRRRKHRWTKLRLDAQALMLNILKELAGPSEEG